MTFTDAELSLLLEALAKAASRHESQARWLIGRAPAHMRRHDDTAAAMRKLRARLLKERMTQSIAA